MCELLNYHIEMLRLIAVIQEELGGSRGSVHEPETPARDLDKKFRMTDVETACCVARHVAARLRAAWRGTLHVHVLFCSPSLLRPRIAEEEKEGEGGGSILVERRVPAARRGAFICCQSTASQRATRPRRLVYSEGMMR